MQKLLFDLFPVILFFIAYKTGDVFFATVVAIVATIAQIGWLKFRGRPVEVMQWVALGTVVVFGGLTLWLHDETFIKWKPTILYWLFGAALFGGRLIGHNLVQRLMGAQLTLPAPVWARLLWIWIGYFVVMGATNLWVAYHWSTDAWVDFKLFGTLGMTIAFVLAQGVLLAPHLKESSDETGR